MNLDLVKKQPLALGGLIKTAFYLWFKTAFANILTALLLFIALSAGVIAFLVLAGALKPEAFIYFFGGLGLYAAVCFILFCAAAAIYANNILRGNKNNVFDGLGIALQGLPSLIFYFSLIGAVLFFNGVLFSLGASKLLLLFYAIAVAFIIILCLVYLVFFPFAVYINKSKTMAAARASYRLVDGRWLYTFGRLLTGFAAAVLMGCLAILAAGFGMYLLFPSRFEEFAAGGLTPIPALFLTGLVVFLFFATGSFLVSYLTAFFVNIQTLPAVKKAPEEQQQPEAAPHIIKQEDLHEFTRIFTGAKEVDVTERIKNDNISALGVQSREDALAGYNIPKEDIHDAFSEAPTQQESDFLEALKELDQKAEAKKKENKDEGQPSSILEEEDK